MPTELDRTLAPQASDELERGGPRRVVQNILVGLALYACIAHLDGALPATSGEPVALRWLRKLAEHPLRVSVGLGLVLGALRPPRRGT